MTTHSTVLCIPGPWRDSSELIAALIDADTGFLFAGQIILEMVSGDGYRAILDGRDEGLASVFISSGPHWRNSAEMAAIDGHNSVVYLFDEGGTRERAEALMKPAAALIRAGGLGVKVESSGLSHSPAQWLQLTSNVQLLGAYKAYVVTVSGETPYSCGMHNFGMRDVRAAAGIQNALELISTFCWYLFSEAPTIRAGQTFSVAPDAPRYRIFDADPIVYPLGSLLENRFGTWQLVPLGD